MQVPFRFYIAAMVFFSTFVNYAMRVNMSVNILAMEVPLEKKSNKTPICLKEDFARNVTKSTAAPTILHATFEKVHYSGAIHGQILAAYGYGYLVSCIPGGFLAEYIGPFKTIFWANVVSAILTAATVPAAMLHWSVVIIIRFLIGALGGFVYPALQILISKWAPPDEKGKFVSALMGNTLGTVVTFPLVGLICEKFSWAFGFFFIALLTAVYLVVFYIVVTDTPNENRFCSEEEKQHIAKSTSAQAKKKLVAPYKEILTSTRFWALAISHTGNIYGLFVILISTPQFFKDYLNFDLKQSGGLSAMPPLLRLFTGVMFGTIGDILKKRYNVTVVRKSFIMCSHILPGLCFIGMMFVGCNWLAATALLVLNQGINGAAVITNLQNPQDLAPNFAGTIFGIMSFVAGFGQFLVPTITAALTDDSQENWQWVFCIAGIIYFITGSTFVMLGTAERQPWNEVPEDV